MCNLKNKYTYEYSSNNNLILQYDYNWDINTDSWINRGKEEYTYDSNNNKIVDYRYLWDKPNSAWVDSSKELTTYDSKSNMTSSESYMWDETTGEISGDYKMGFRYNENNSPVLYELYNWNDGEKDWDRTGTAIFYYDKNPLSNNTEELTQVSIYPNPISSNNILSISTKEDKGFKYSIFTSSGKLVMDGSTDNKTQNLDVSILDKGIYVLKITSDNKVINRKFIK